MAGAVIVIPCYNEAQRFDAGKFREFARQRRDVRFLFVNDGSTDGTQAMLEELARSDPQALGVLTLAKNSGKAEAVRQGLLKALDESPGCVGFFDADLATPLQEIPLFLEVFNQHPQIDWVFGSRVNLLGRSVKRNLVRHYLGRIFATATSAALQLGVYDTQCGAKLFRTDERLRRILQTPFVTTWIFDVELIARLIREHREGRGRPAEQCIYELPLRTWRDVKGSKIKWTDFLRAAAELWRIYWTYMRPARSPQARRDEVGQ